MIEGKRAEKGFPGSDCVEQLERKKSDNNFLSSLHSASSSMEWKLFRYLCQLQLVEGHILGFVVQQGLKYNLC